MILSLWKKKTKNLMEFRGSNDLELHVNVVGKRGTKIEEGSHSFIIPDPDDCFLWIDMFDVATNFFDDLEDV